MTDSFLFHERGAWRTRSHLHPCVPVLHQEPVVRCAASSYHVSLCDNCILEDWNVYEIKDDSQNITIVRRPLIGVLECDIVRFPEVIGNSNLSSELELFLVVFRPLKPLV